MRIVILGASGGVGKWVTRLAAADGHDVTTVVRPERPFHPPPGVRVLRGSALDVDILAAALVDQDVLISCLGAQRTQPWNPWSPLRSPSQVAEPAARAIVAVQPATSIRRVVAISAAGVGDSFARTNSAMRWMIRHSTVGQMYGDLEGMEAILRSSPLNWIAVRPVTLVNAAATARTHVLSRYRAASIVGRADVAAWLLRMATDHVDRDRTPMIGWW
jgi:uncharacterized protein YbjT (DUF2867 family)